MVERLGDARAAEVWAEHDRRARDLIAYHHGREIGRTDGFFLLFDDPARTWLGDWPGGVYFADLSEARSLDGIFFPRKA